MKLFIIYVSNFSWKLNTSPWSACTTVADYSIGSLARHHFGPNHNGSHFEISHNGCQKSDKVFVYTCIVIAVFCNFFYKSQLFVLAYIRSNMSTSDIKCWKTARVGSWQTNAGVCRFWCMMLVFWWVIFVIAAPKQSNSCTRCNAELVVEGPMI